MTTELVMPEELISVEEALKLLVAAMTALRKPGLSRAEISRLRNIVQAARIYKELIADYMDYRGIEAELIDLREEYHKLAESESQRTTQP